jgi:multidrug efflux pump
MNISDFFIKRPIFAAVISIIIFVIGGIAYFRLPLSEYPKVVPPTVVVRTTFPGANPAIIADTVASPLEHQIVGVENMLYMFSQATADGVMTLTVTFALGADLDKAQVQVQNRVTQVLPRLPQIVQQLGVTTEKQSPDYLMVVHLRSPDNRYNMLYLANLAILQVKDDLERLSGVGNVQILGAGEFSMRVWLNPNELAMHNLTTTDVVQAIREQNVQVASGALGSPPAAAGSAAFQLLVDTQGRLKTEEEFGNIIVRAAKEGQITRIRDVGRVELGSSTYALRSLLDRRVGQWDTRLSKR